MAWLKWMDPLGWIHWDGSIGMDGAANGSMITYSEYDGTDLREGQLLTLDCNGKMDDTDGVAEMTANYKCSILTEGEYDRI